MWLALESCNGDAPDLLKKIKLQNGGTQPPRNLMVSGFGSRHPRQIEGPADALTTRSLHGLADEGLGNVGASASLGSCLPSSFAFGAG